MKEIIFIHNSTGKEIFIKCDNGQIVDIDGKSYFNCTVADEPDKFDKSVGLFSLEHYSMYVKKELPTVIKD